MNRKDIHRPSAINWTDYAVVGYYDRDAEARTFDGFEVAERHRLNNMIAENPIRRHGGNGGTCFVCGQWNIRYVVVVQHSPTGQYGRMGEDCASNVGLEPDEVRISQMRRAAEAARTKAAIMDKREQFEAVAENREAADFLNELRMFDHSYDSGNARDYRKAYPACLGQTGAFIDDLTHKLNRYGSLSEKQVAAVLKIKTRNAEWVERNNNEVTAPAPTGRVEVTGEIVATKVKDGYYGVEYKMIVKDDRGFRIWSTIPKAIDTFDINELKGQRVSLTATLTPSDDDETFAFAKRPSKAQILGGSAA